MLKIGACDISEAGITIRIKVIVNQTKAGKKEINLGFTFFLRKTKKKGLPKGGLIFILKTHYLSR